MSSKAVLALLAVLVASGCAAGRDGGRAREDASSLAAVRDAADRLPTEVRVRPASGELFVDVDRDGTAESVERRSALAAGVEPARARFFRPSRLEVVGGHLVVEDARGSVRFPEGAISSVMVVHQADEVAPAELPPPPQWKVVSKPADAAPIVAGSLLMAAGLAGGIGLAVAAANVPSRGSGAGWELFGGDDERERAALGFGSALSFAAALGAGIPLIALGAPKEQRVRTRTATAATNHTVPRVGIGPTSVTVDWSF